VAAASRRSPLRAARTPDPHVRAQRQDEGSRVSAAPYARSRAAETFAGYLAAAAIFVSITGVMYRPLRLIPLALVLALIATAIGGRALRLATWAVVIGTLAFVVGMAAAVITSNPLW